LGKRNGGLRGGRSKGNNIRRDWAPTQGKKTQTGRLTPKVAAKPPKTKKKRRRGGPKRGIAKQRGGQTAPVKTVGPTQNTHRVVSKRAAQEKPAVQSVSPKGRGATNGWSPEKKKTTKRRRARKRVHKKRPFKGQNGASRGKVTALREKAGSGKKCRKKGKTALAPSKKEKKKKQQRLPIVKGEAKKTNAKPVGVEWWAIVEKDAGREWRKKVNTFTTAAQGAQQRTSGGRSESWPWAGRKGKSKEEDKPMEVATKGRQTNVAPTRTTIPVSPRYEESKNARTASSGRKPANDARGSEPRGATPNQEGPNSRELGKEWSRSREKTVKERA